MNKTAVLMIALTLMAMLPACTQQYNAEKDFTAKPVDGGKGVEITGYVGEKFEVRIPPRIQNLPVTSIGEEAFSEKNITSVTIPNGVTTIGEGAFSWCDSLVSVTMPNSVTTIGSNAFSGCMSLASVTIPNGVAYIWYDAFYGCISLASVTFEGTIDSNWFMNAFEYLGDLRAKFYATDPTNGTPGTYTTTAPVGSSSVWTKVN